MSERRTSANPAASSGRIRVPYVSLDELAKLCSCGHQNGGHIGGAARSGWPIYDPIWAAALGWCTIPGCLCRGRTSGSATTPPAPAETPAVIVPPPPIATALTGPCGHGTGPCGATPTRPYAEGPRCTTHAPTAITGGCTPEVSPATDLAERNSASVRRWAA